MNAPGAPDSETLVTLPGGRFAMGSQDVFAYPDDGEGPVHEVELAAVPRSTASR